MKDGPLPSPHCLGERPSVIQVLLCSDPNLLSRVRLVLILLVVPIRRLFHQRVVGVIANGLDNAQAFGTALTEEQSVAWRKVLGPLDELERHRGSVPCPYQLPINIDDGASLGDWPDVEHRLVLLLDSGGMG